MSHYDVIILGAGAAGLFCAITAAQRGRNVLVLERSNKVGKKILMSGGGRCNFTNLHIDADNFISHNPHFCKSALNQYSQWDFISLVEKHGIAYHEKTLGQLFCDNSSKDILNMLLSECDKANVTIKTHTETNNISLSHSSYKIITNEGEYLSSSFVIACGGLSIPSLGGSDYGYQIAKQFDMPVIEPRAALVPFTFSGQLKTLFAEISGLSVDTSVTTSNTYFNEATLFTHRGLSGPAILQISSYWSPGADIQINLLPELDAEEHLIGLKNNKGKTVLRTQLYPLLPKALVMQLEKLWWSDMADQPLAEWKTQDLVHIASQLQSWQLKPSGTEGYRTAEVTLGGVDTDYLSSKTMESKTQNGLYFIGEVIDVTGHLGGFNFQWAWSSGYAAGQNV